MSGKRNYVCVHGHFYQPPRENAWLEKIEVQDTAHPYHDWNERIADECYTPNTASRILDKKGIIQDIVNNYSKISFNYGPTLLSWLQENVPETYQSILEADKLSISQFSGHGNATAQSYNHLIMPLANARDIETQIAWGIRDFEHRFNRLPEGMWLSETAVNTHVLEALARNNITYTILAPRQASRIKKINEEQWTDVKYEKVDPRRPYLCRLPSGNTITLFFYDGQVAKDVAFNKLLDNGKDFANRLLKAFGSEDTGEPMISHIATDGESYGHHHRHGEMALAFCTDEIENGNKAHWTNYGYFLDQHPPTYEAEIIEDSSWSCVHGVERWKSSCGCHTGGAPGWNQKWREPLRNALDWLREELIIVFDRECADLFHQPWDARNGYISVVLDRSEKNIEAFLDEYGKELDDNGKRSKALRMLEMQRHAMLMYTSCGWFFNDVSGIETTQILQYACRAIQLAEQVSSVDLEDHFLELLNLSVSNLKEYGTAADMYRKYVIPTRLDLLRVGMHYAVASLFDIDQDELEIFNYTAETEFFERRDAGIQRLVLGRIKVKSKTTYSENYFSFGAIYMGQHNLTGHISNDMERDKFDQAYHETLDAFRSSNLGDMVTSLENYFGGEKFSIWHLFKDEKRKVFNNIMDKYLGKLDVDLKDIYDQEYQLINALTSEKIPIPEIYMHTFRHVFNSELKSCLGNDYLDISTLQSIVHKFKKWDVSISSRIPFKRIINEMIKRNLDALSSGKNGIERVKRLNLGLEILQELDFDFQLYQAQNMYFHISRGEQANSWNGDKKKHFEKLGAYLGVKVK